MKQAYRFDKRVLWAVEATGNSEQRDVLSRRVFDAQVHPVLLAVHDIYAQFSRMSKQKKVQRTSERVALREFGDSEKLRLAGENLIDLVEHGSYITTAGASGPAKTRRG